MSEDNKFINKYIVYQIKNLLNGKLYIGSSKNYKKRISTHITNLNKNKHVNEHLQKAWNKYGSFNFEISIIEVVENEKDLLSKEQYWIDLYKSYDRKNGYNKNPIADKPPIGINAGAWKKGNIPWNKGKINIYSESTLAKMKNKIISSETRIKMSESAKKKIFTEEHRKHLGEAVKRRIITDETRKKLSESMKRKGIIPPGIKNMTQEQRFLWKKQMKNNQYAAKLNAETVKEIKTKYQTGDYTQIELAREYCLSKSAINEIVHNKSWTWVKIDNNE